MNNLEELKKAALGANLHGWTGFEDALNADGYSEAVSKFIQHCSPSVILKLIASQEAAQKLAQHYKFVPIKLTPTMRQQMHTIGDVTCHECGTRLSYDCTENIEYSWVDILEATPEVPNAK